MQIVPIALTQTDWLNFTKGSEKFLGESITRALDNDKIIVGTAESYLSALTVFKDNTNDPKQIEDFALEHVNISFLMTLEMNLYHHLLEYISIESKVIRSFSFNSTDEVAVIVTASLKQWRIYCHTLGHSYKMKEFSYMIYQVLRKMGYSSIFDKFKVEENLDGSKQLVRR